MDSNEHIVQPLIVTSHSLSIHSLLLIMLYPFPLLTYTHIPSTFHR